MNQRPKLDKKLDCETFSNYYYLKQELVDFCKESNMPTSGSKTEITERISYFLKTGKVPSFTPKIRKTKNIQEINENIEIEPNFVCSEKHRAFFKEKIGEKAFSFNVVFQKWLKNNPGKTYGEAIRVYYEILQEKKTKKTTIDKQFEYNTYIRDFFQDNLGHTLQQAITCWKYKKGLKGHNRYEREDLIALS